MLKFYKNILKTLFLLVIFCTTEITNAQIFSKTVVWNNSSSSNRVNLYVIPDGFTAAEMPAFAAETEKLVAKLQNTSPFKEYINFVRILRIDVPSAQSGTSHPHSAGDCGSMTTSELKDTYFKSTFDMGGIHRLLVPDFNLVQQFLFKNAQDYDMVLMIVNSPVYGGSGGSIATYSLHSSSVDIALHELGHSFAGLGDEYTATGSGCSGGYPNVATTSDINAIPWSAWVNYTTVPGVCGNSSDIGLFKGAGYCSTQFRPKCTCKMRDVKKEYCEVCSEQIVSKIHSITTLLEHQNGLTVHNFNIEKDTLLSGILLQSTNGTTNSKWILDGVKVLDNNLNYLCKLGDLSFGSHRLVLTATDNSNFLKIVTKPADSLVWIINKQNGSSQPVTAIPSYFSVSNITENSATASWLAQSDVPTYQIQFKAANETNWGTSYSLGNTNYFSKFSLIENTNYEARLRAIKNNLASNYAFSTFKTLPSTINLCAIPTNLTVADILPFNATVSWSLLSGVQSYVVKHKIKGSSVITSSIVTGNNFVLSYLIANTEYEITVQAVCGNTFGQAAYYGFKTKPIEVCPDNYEPNNSSNSASSIPLNTVINGLIPTADDQDFYFFTLPTTSNVSITLNNLIFDYDIKLQKQDGTVIGFSASSGKSDENITKTLLAGTYFVRIYGFSGAFSPNNCYGLRVQAVSVGGVPIETQDLSNQEMVISPNPSTGQTQLFFDSKHDTETSIMLMNSLGNVMMNEKKQMKKGENKIDYNFETLNDGIYYVRLSNYYRTITQKLVITKLD